MQRLIQPHFDYACSAWYPDPSKKLKNGIQTSQNKGIRVCLQLDRMSHISQKEFKTIGCPLKKDITSASIQLPTLIINAPII